MASEGGLTALLLEAQSPDFQRRAFAEQQLANAEQTNFTEFLKALATELADESKPETARQLAGIVLKNAISGRDSKIDASKRQRWIELSPEGAKVEIRQKLLESLESPVVVARNTACQAMSKIARVELPTGLWPQLMPKLEQLAANSVPRLKRTAAYQAIGYICEDLQILSDEVGRDLLENSQKKQLLACLSVGLVDSDLEVKLAALKAFFYGILFADEFISNDADRNTLFQVLGDCLTTAHEPVELAAWEVLLQMAQEYYAALGPYMAQLRDLSLQRISNGTIPTQLSSIEFWSTICDEELTIEADAESTGSQVQLENYVLAAKDVLLPVLFEATTRQSSEDADEDEWTVSMAAGTCVTLCAQVLKDNILPQALTFIEANFTHSLWQRRDAAVLVYGSILEGPSPRAFTQLLQKSFEPLCKCLNDDSKAVRDTTAWTVGRIAKFHLDAVEDKLGSSPEQPGVIPLLIMKLSDEPRVASNCCFALYEICHAINDTTTTPDRSRLDPFFRNIAEALVTVSRRSDANEHQLRNAAYHALYMLVRQVGNAPEIMSAMEILMTQMLDWLNDTLQVPLSDEVSTVQGLMCGCLNALIARLEKRVLPQSDKIAGIFRQIIANQKQLVDAKQASWHTSTEEALLACNRLVTAMQRNFSRYLGSFTPLLAAVMRSREDSDICAIAIDIVGNLATQLQDDFAVEVAVFVNELFAILRDGTAPITLKPKAMAALSDIVIMLPRAFENHLKEFFEFLGQAAAAKLNQGPMDSEEWVQYIMELRDATLNAYTAAIYCVRDVSSTASKSSTLMEKEVSTILEFIYTIMGDVVSSNSNLKNAVQLAQDLVQCYKGTLVSHIQNHPLYGLLKERCQQVDDPEIRQQLMVLDELMTRYSITPA